LAQISLICLALYTVTSLVVGIRLIMRSYRSRGLPEFLIGLTYAASSGIGYPLTVTAAFMPSRAATLGAMAIGEVLIVLGCSCFLFFNAKVFRPTAGWSVPAAALGSLLLAVCGAAVVAAFFSTADIALVTERTRIWTVLFLLVLVAGQGWTAIEGMRHYRMMRRRLVLGLAEPVVTNRFLLWGISGLVSLTWNGVVNAYLLAGVNINAHPVPVFAVSFGGLVTAVCLVLTFMPPAWYVRWIERERDPRALAAV
jgi:hypothetical protein